MSKQGGRGKSPPRSNTSPYPQRPIFPCGKEKVVIEWIVGETNG